MTSGQSQRNEAIDAIAQRILVDAKPNRLQRRASKAPMEDVRRLVRRDYVRAARKHLGYRELRKLLARATEVWPQLNRERLQLLSKEEFAAISRRLSLNLSTQPHRAPDGLALRGFYMQASRLLMKRPMIYVNTAHHPAAVGATFCHEVGHHLGSRIFRGDDAVHFFFDSAYSTHLDDPVELAADVVVSLAAYPRPFAERLFAESWHGGLVAHAQHLTADTVEQICHYLKDGYRVDFRRSGQPRRNLAYLAGMVHFAKLRWALLAEYDI